MAGLSDPRGMVPYIRERAPIYGINPDVAVRVAGSEGLGNFYGDYRGGQPTSFGSFQLYTRGGVGNDFMRDTGLDPSNPANERATIDYALDRASQRGWGEWYGAANSGIGRWEGIGETRVASPQANWMDEQLYPNQFDTGGQPVPYFTESQWQGGLSDKYPQYFSGDASRIPNTTLPPSQTDPGFGGGTQQPWDVYSDQGIGSRGTFDTNTDTMPGTSFINPGVTYPDDGGGGGSFIEAPSGGSGAFGDGIETPSLGGGGLGGMFGGGMLGGILGGLFGGGKSASGDQTGFFRWVQDWALRGAIIILGFVFVIAGLFLLNNVNITNVIPAGKALKALK